MFFPIAALADVSASIGFKIDAWLAYTNEEAPELTTEEARITALRSCERSGARQCQHFVNVIESYCGAIAVSTDSNNVGRGTAHISENITASSRALRVCEEPTSNSPAKYCKVIWQYCNYAKTTQSQEETRSSAAASFFSASFTQGDKDALIIGGLIVSLAAIYFLSGLAALGRKSREYEAAKRALNAKTKKKRKRAPRQKSPELPEEPASISVVADAAPSQSRALVPQKQSPVKKRTAAKSAGVLRPNTMNLKTKRSQRKNTFGNVVFILDARMEVSQDVLENIKKYKLGKKLVYESANREKYRANAQAHLEKSHSDVSLFASPGKQALGLGKTFYRLARSGISAGISAMSLKITVDSLIAGVHVECKDMDELLATEDAIKIAGQNLRAYLDTFATFDNDEQVAKL